MATEQTTLTAAVVADAVAEPEPREVDVNALFEAQANHADVRTCNGCGSHVSKDYARVQGDNDGNVWACPSCSSRNERLRGAAADPNHEDNLGESL